MTDKEVDESRSFDTEVIQNFLKEKDEVTGWIEEIDGATKTITHLLDESKQAFDPEKDLEISRNLKRCTATASGFAKKAKVRLAAVQYLLAALCTLLHRRVPHTAAVARAAGLAVYLPPNCLFRFWLFGGCAPELSALSRACPVRVIANSVTASAPCTGAR
jgi:hypothetical protein